MELVTVVACKDELEKIAALSRAARLLSAKSKSPAQAGASYRAFQKLDRRIKRYPGGPEAYAQRALKPQRASRRSVRIKPSE
jgi:hypothetical protein